MPSGSTLSPLSCSPSSLRKYVTVTFLNASSITLPVEAKTRVCEIEAHVVHYLQRLGMKDTDLFGLAVRSDDEFLFADGENKLTKYASRQWKASTNGLDNAGSPLLKFEFRVKYYVESHLFIRDPASRLHYYLQLRENLLSYGQLLQEQQTFILASLALQADLGDYKADRHKGQYFEATSYIPHNMLDQMGVSYFFEHMPTFHRKHKGLSQADAQAHFIREASQADAPHNIHLYHLRRKKHDPSTEVALSICDEGIGIYEEDLMHGLCSKKLVQCFHWSNIEDLSFDKKKFEIRAPCYPGKLTFYTSSDEKSKHLLLLCRLTHQFSRNLRLRTTEYLRSSNHDRKPTRDIFLYNEPTYHGIDGEDSLTSALGGYLGLEDGVQRISICSTSSSNTTSGVFSDRLLLMGSSHELDRDVGLGSSTAQSIESGVASITRSLSMASSVQTESSDHEDNAAGDLQYESSDTPEMNSAWEILSRGGESSGFGRTESIHSSSSQHSASTVRSRYSLVPSRNRHELALGAQLADLSLAPDLPDLADLPTMAADMVIRGEDVPDSVHHMNHNCCSTCCDDNTSIGSDDEVGDKDNEKSICRCGACTICLKKVALGEDKKGLYIGYRRSEEATTQSFQTSSAFCGGDDDSVTAQPDLDASVASTYNFSEEDFLQLDNNDDYVEFYKGGRGYTEQMAPTQSVHLHNEPDETVGNQRADISLERTAETAASTVGGRQSSRSHRSSPAEEDQCLDYSVESAQASLAASYPINKEMLSWSLLMGSHTIGNLADQIPFVQLAPVSMSKVITTTPPVNIASSRFNTSASSPNSRNNVSDLHHEVFTADTIISEAAVSNTSEAPAKFITSKPRITVLKAHTQLAATTAPSFSSVPLTRAKIHTLPQVQVKPKVDSIQSLQRIALPEPRRLGLPPPYNSTDEVLPSCANLFTTAQLSQVPVIRANNYLDVHASANLTRERLRSHPEQLPSKTPRSLYLKNQKKKLLQQTILDKHKIEQLQQQLLSDSVCQPAAYAQGVGVPLLPSPTYAGYPQANGKKHSYSFCCEQHYTPFPQQCHIQQQQCCQTPSQNHLPDMGISPQNILYQPHIRNFFQNPPPPMPHPGYGIGACPGNQQIQISPEMLSPTYQCASDPGTYPVSSPNQHRSSHLSQPSLATVYTKQVTLSQIEQFNAQLNSDEDYVIYPHKDPAISRQEYMDAKQSQVLANQAQKHMEQQLHGSCNAGTMGYPQIHPSYRSPKASPLYRSTPNVAGSLGPGGILSSYPSYQSLASQGSTHQPGSSSGYSSMARGRYFSQQSLASSFSSAPSAYSASTQSLTGSFDPYVDPAPIPNSPSAVMRVRSDESILSSTALIEPETSPGSISHSNSSTRPPPPYRPKEVLDDSRDRSSGVTPTRITSRSRSRPRVTLQQVRECGTQLDVPFLAALCSDASLLAQKGGRSSSKSPKRRKSSKSSGRASDTPVSSTATSPEQEPSMKTSESRTMTGPFCRYSLSGVYTTNQVPGPHVTTKSPQKSSNGVHQHPEFQSKKKPHPSTGGKLKHSRSIKETPDYRQI